MTNARDFFSGNFLKAEDCKGGELVEILSEGELEEIQTPEGKPKAVMNYEVSVNGVKKSFTPNMTNGNILVKAFGEEDKAWIGKKFTIKLEKVRVFGKVRDSIIVMPLVEETPKQ
jgi:hypothetical protein